MNLTFRFLFKFLTNVTETRLYMLLKLVQFTWNKWIVISADKKMCCCWDSIFKWIWIFASLQLRHNCICRNSVMNISYNRKLCCAVIGCTEPVTRLSECIAVGCEKSNESLSGLWCACLFAVWGWKWWLPLWSHDSRVFSMSLLLKAVHEHVQFAWSFVSAYWRKRILLSSLWPRAFLETQFSQPYG